MCASQRTYGPAFPRVSFSLFFVLACLASCGSVALAQRSALPPAPSEQNHTLNLRFSGEQPRPLAMASGDFDEDGIADLVIGYGLKKGGAIALLRGNPDAIAPRTESGWQAAGRHEYIEPFLQRGKPILVAVDPSLLISADVNGDGNLDLVYATEGSAQLNVMFGDGKGNFLAPISATIPGGITALAAYRPGAPLMGEAIIAGYQLNQGARLSILSYSSNGFSTRATYGLPRTATAMSVANLDADLIPDTAIVAGGQLLILHGKNAISGGGAITTVPVSDVEAVTAGEFVFDRHPQLQLSVLTSNGDVVMLAHQGFDPTPYTPQEIAAMRHANSNNMQMPAQPADNTGGAPWIEVERNSTAAVHSVSGRPPIIVRSRSTGGFEDLVVLNSSQQQRTLISHALTSPRGLSSAVALPSTRVTSGGLSSGNVVAAVSAPVSPDARDGLVVLSSDNVSPDISVPNSGNTYYVNTTADNTTAIDPPDSSRCSNGTEVCTLRDAVTYSSDDATDNINAGKSDTIMVPPGTYNLSYKHGTFDANANAVTHLEILGPVTIIGSTSGGGVIINGNNYDEIFTINPGIYGSYNPSGDSNVFSLALENLTLENGKNLNNPDNSSTGNINDVGGCINWDAYGTGNLTITNSTVVSCTNGYGDGGGVWAYNSAGGGTGTLTLSGDTIKNNSAPGSNGGGLAIDYPSAAISATNTTFSGNTAGYGGGIFLEGRTPPPASPESTLTGVTISSNAASPNDGGGILTYTGVVLSGSLISNNSAGGYGGGLFSNTAGDGSQTTVTSTNFLSNLATTAGGAIAVGLESESQGNILQVGLSRIYGNISTNGASGLANGESTGAGEVIATDNWWGCNNGPTTAGDGCDQAVLYNSAGTLTTVPYAQLGFTSNITTIPLGGSMNLTVTMGSGIAGAFPAVATNYSYTYNVTGVTANPALTTGTFNTSGVGTAALTPVPPSSNTGGSVSVMFDNQKDTIDFTADGPTATSLHLTVSPSGNFPYGQPPTSVTVQLMPSNASGISASDFQVVLDGSVSSSFIFTSIGTNLYSISGPFNLLSRMDHTFEVEFLGATGYQASHVSTTLTVTLGSVIIGDTVSPTNLVQGQGGTVTVTVTGVGTGTTPTGSINYALDGGTSQTVTLVAGSAQISIPTVVATGNHTLALNYNGDTNYTPSSISTTLTIYGRSLTTFASLSTSAATIDVIGLGFTAPSGTLAFTDVTTSSPVVAPVTLNTSTATTALTPQVTTSTGSNTLPVWTELADVNGDGIPDLITSLYQTDSVTVQLGNGDGTFGAATSILIGSGFGPAEVHAVSLRGNGILDLIVGSFNLNEIAVLLGNNNNGTFGTPTLYTVGSSANTPTSLTTGHFNGASGALDVAVANFADNTISILTGNGNGTLTVGSPINVGHAPEAIRAGDFTGSGYSDLAVANYGDGTVTTLLNNQNGTFTPTTFSMGSGAGSGPQALAINGSGSSLLLGVANYKDNTVSVMKSNGSGAFGAQTIVNVGKGPDDVSFADFNGDGIPDLAVSNYTDGTVNLALGSSGGSYTVLGPFKVGNNPYSAAVGDLDFDGTPDVVVSNCFSNNAGVLLDGTRIAVPYTGLSLPSSNLFNATYTPDGASKYGSSTSANTAP